MSNDKIKTTLRLDKSLWKAVQHRAIQDDTTAEMIVTAALVKHLDIKPNGEIVVTFERRKKARKS